MKVRDVRAMTDSRLHALRNTIETTVTAWQAHWGVPSGAMGQVVIACAANSVHAHQANWIADDEEWALIRQDSGFASEVIGSLAVALDPTAMNRRLTASARALGKRLCEDLFVRVLACGTGKVLWQARALSDTLHKSIHPLAGLVTVKLVCGQETCTLTFLSNDGFKAEPLPLAQQNRLEQAAQGARTKLHVLIGQTQVSIAQLQGLQTGDVVRLNAHIHDLVAIVDDHLQCQFLAWPGQHRGLRAIQTVRSKADDLQKITESFSMNSTKNPGMTNVAGTTAHLVELPELESAKTGNVVSLVARSLMQGMPVRVQASLGTLDTTLGHLLALEEGEVLTLGQPVDAPVDLMIDGMVVARGDLVIAGEHFGVRVTSLPQLGYEA